ncbi:hypothetical protein V492_08426 [Pseudogymnoascus sp. VKM F-4246]|nr:hypothetical protein V492_08426 [Pseudogymnoascus sp. VKM F-4246]
MSAKGPNRGIKCHKVVVVGEPGVGKTTTKCQFIDNGFNECYDPTLGEHFRKQVIVSSRVALVEIIQPVSPNDIYRALWEQHVCAADAALLVYSITSLQSFERITALRGEVLAALAGPHRKSRGGGSGAPEGRGKRPFPICLVGNKSDRDVDREVSVKAGAELAKELECSFLEMSAKNGTNVEEAFLRVVRVLEGDDAEEKEEQEPVAAVGGFRGRLGRIVRSIQLKKK